MTLVRPWFRSEFPVSGTVPGNTSEAPYRGWFDAAPTGGTEPPEAQVFSTSPVPGVLAGVVESPMPEDRGSATGYETDLRVGILRAKLNTYEPGRPGTPLSPILVQRAEDYGRTPRALNGLEKTVGPEGGSLG